MTPIWAPSRSRWCGTIMLLLMSWAAVTHAHPGVGIVQDRRGDVFYTDLAQVWRITPDGQRSIAVRDVHTHELCLDRNGDLLGEHLWYDGAKWWHRMWSRTASGSVRQVRAAREGFLRDDSFVRDAAGNRYWTDGGVIRQRTPDGRITSLASGLRAAGRMTATPGGTLFLIDGGDLRRVSPSGEVTTIVAGLSAQRPPHPGVTQAHHHMGVWTDAEGRVYVAVAGERSVMRVGAAGDARVVARSPAPWAPSGGMVARDGALWLLEFDADNRVRVRRISDGAREQVFGEASGRR